jgi:hypothetical protein
MRAEPNSNLHNILVLQQSHYYILLSNNMAFQPITYAGQYPPLKSRSASDVSSFAALHASLRQSLPELAREGDRILNEEMLARFVDGVSRFQRDHLGRVSSGERRPDVVPSMI